MTSVRDYRTVIACAIILLTAITGAFAAHAYAAATSTAHLQAFAAHVRDLEAQGPSEAGGDQLVLLVQARTYLTTTAEMAPAETATVTAFGAMAGLALGIGIAVFAAHPVNQMVTRQARERRQAERDAIYD